ncbi:hypothetical protein LIER_11480 [Lithospermum erythrorhizon]|uniref:Protein kinase domain-containing protein n=1 Tax=Lithospermum erythrorhizon TaxID=34254 RepID=A0AAV3PN77_LITER
MDWTRGPVLGRGSSATVSLATSSSGELFAVKSTEFSCSDLLQKERGLVSQLNSPYVIKYLGFDITHENNKPMYNLFIEYAQNGTLYDVIKKQGGSLNESLIQFYAYQILQGLDYLHSNELVHCDIKPQNILICEDGVKIGDFDCAKSIRDKTTFSGTPMFMAPEVARGEEQGFPADIWSLGCTIIEMATGSNPWPELKEPVSALYRIGYSEDELELPNWFSGEAKEFLKNCLMRNPKERWTAKQLLEHKFFNELEGNSKMVTLLGRKSPTSILDQDIWDSFEVSEASCSVANPGILSINSPASRISKLISDGGSALNLPGWIDEEDWITVRSIDEEGISSLSKGNSDITQDCEELVKAEDWAIETVDEEEELLSSISFQDSLFNYYDGEIRDVIRLDTDADLVVSIESLDHVLVISTIEFESKTFEISFKFVKTCLHLYHFLNLLVFLVIHDLTVDAQCP